MKKIAVADKEACVACGVCVKACKHKAISIWRGCYAVIDAEECVGCGKCAKRCPSECIDMKKKDKDKKNEKK